MNRSVLFALVAAASLFACRSSPESVPDTAAVADAGAPTGGSPAQDAFTVDAGPSKPTATSTGECSADGDCGTGKVCEKSGEHAVCAQGCHTDAQCGDGQTCRQVQCIRWPCPGQCETRSRK